MCQRTTIFRILAELWQQGAAIDLITFTQVLKDKNLLDTVGGPAWVTSLFTFVPTAANIAYYLDIVREKHVGRRIIATATESARRAYEEQDDLTGVLEDYQTARSRSDNWSRTTPRVDRWPRLSRMR